jgi:cold-inducible RNA-binding protein
VDFKEKKVKNLFVGNLSFQATENDLRSLFEPFGEITNVRLMTDRDTGRSRGFGFVEMATEEAAQQAVAALNGKQASGRALTVNEARPKPERTGFGRDRDRGGFSNNDYQPSGRQRRESRW